MTQASEDCYFYYYSTCKKGPRCPFRHEPLARSTETTCEDWQFGKCVKDHCEFRHMSIQVNRSAIACYWEAQPAGCQKAHCVFKHAMPRPVAAQLPISATPAATLPTAVVETRNVPSPKVNQILIHTVDTDEDSPQKKMRVKPVVDNTRIAKKMSLRSLTKPVTTTLTELESEQPPSQLLEEELLEIVKRGVSVNAGCETRQISSASHLPVKVKSLKEIKREKILRARLEYERKKLLASQQDHVTEGIQEQTVRKVKEGRSHTSRIQKSSSATHRSNKTEDVVVSQRPPSKITEKRLETVRKVKEGSFHTSRIQKSLSATRRSNKTEDDATSQHSLSKKTPELCSLSNLPQVQSKDVKSAGEVRVKSFSEIMEEKRRRLGEVQSNTTHTDTQPFIGHPKKHESPVIAARKMKIRSTENSTTAKRKLTRLKRTASTDLQDRVLPKLRAVDNKEADVHTGGADHNDSAEQPLELNTHSIDVEEAFDTNGDTSQHSQISQPGSEADEWLKVSSTDNRDEDDEELGDELGLLEDSSYLKTDTFTQDISDDDLMNEMEQLLA